MQQLQFEESWGRALSAKDRLLIEKIFNETKQLNNSNFLCSPIREAINHRHQLLVTVLVHNFSGEPLTFNKTRLVYRTQGQVIADNEFTLPTLKIPPFVSMPWTFIFPKDSYTPITGSLMVSDFKHGYSTR